MSASTAVTTEEASLFAPTGSSVLAAFPFDIIHRKYEIPAPKALHLLAFVFVKKLRNDSASGLYWHARPHNLTPTVKTLQGLH
jgi:hypothetical protein